MAKPIVFSENSTEFRIITFAQSHPTGFMDKDLLTEMPEIDVKDRAKAINTLLAEGYFDLFKKDGTLFYKIKDQRTPAIKGADNEEKVVYRIIEEAGNKGIWIRDIRIKSNLMMMALNKILKSLETKKLIKAVKSVSASKRKVYMLYSFEPDASVTGGAWYQGQDFESEFVELLNQQCLRYLIEKREDAVKTTPASSGPYAIRNKCFASIIDIHKFISDSGISNVQLSVDDIDMIMNTVVLDGKAEFKLAPNNIKLYRAIESLIATPSYVASPCGVCPVINRCSTLGSVNPISCEYLQDWMK